MKENNKGVMILVVVLILVFLLPWGRINWGKIRWMQPETVTVTGEAKSTQKNQIATFNAGVDAVNSDKDKAINDVNGKMEAIIAVIKDFGIKLSKEEAEKLIMGTDEFMDSYRR